jgi:D-alanine-D-alanine ligase
VKIGVLHQQLSAAAGKDELDVLDQVKAVERGLRELGHEAVVLTLSLDLTRTVSDLGRLKPDLVFNLVEALEGSGRLLHLGSALLDFLRIPYSGCPTEALFTTSNKILTKSWLRAADLPTPAWLPASEVEKGMTVESPAWIVKSVWEHASFGISDKSLVSNQSELAACLQYLEPSIRSDFFAEEYVPGREFNLSILAGSAGPEVLPPAEILFVDYPPDKPHIVDYRAKWETGSFEYEHTIRTFEFPSDDAPLTSDLRRLALDCWRVFGLRGYARVDFRVDEAGRPWILEINANPCISRGAGFLSACEQAGLGETEVIARLIFDALEGRSR